MTNFPNYNRGYKFLTYCLTCERSNTVICNLCSVKDLGSVGITEPTHFKQKEFDLGSGLGSKFEVTEINIGWEDYENNRTRREFQN